VNISNVSFVLLVGIISNIYFICQEIQLEGEQMGRVSGGLDELNSILSITQKKINRFKV
jgi:hypothetical protein